MNDIAAKEYIFASDFDQTLTFSDSGYVRAEVVGIPTSEFERKSTGMARLNLAVLGAAGPGGAKHGKAWQGKAKPDIAIQSESKHGPGDVPGLCCVWASVSRRSSPVQAGNRPLPIAKASRGV